MSSPQQPPQQPAHPRDAAALPPTISIPTSLVSSRRISPAALLTWIQLRLLAGGDLETPPFTLRQFSERVGKGITALHSHLTELRSSGAISWIPAGRGFFIVRFEDAGEQAGPSAPQPPTETGPENRKNGKPKNRKNEKLVFRKIGIAPSLNTLTNQDSCSVLKESESLKLDSGSKNQEGEAGFQLSGNLESSSAETRLSCKREFGGAVDLYRSQTGIRPNASQRAMIFTEIADLELWRTTLEHWLSHGWNPRNIPGLLDLYSRRGPPGCTLCRPKPKTSPPHSPDPLELLEKKYGLD